MRDAAVYALVADPGFLDKPVIARRYAITAVLADHGPLAVALAVGAPVAGKIIITALALRGSEPKGLFEVKRG